MQKEEEELKDGTKRIGGGRWSEGEGEEGEGGG